MEYQLRHTGRLGTVKHNAPGLSWTLAPGVLRCRNVIN